MYEKIIEWGTSGLFDSVDRNDKRLSEISDREQRIIIEAIKTKNAMVLSRFEYALKVADELTAVQSELRKVLVTFRMNNEKLGNEKSWSRRKINSSGFLDQVYKPLIRSFLDTRNKFEPINDLFSIYSVHATIFLDHEKLLQLTEERFSKPPKVADFATFYLNVFGHVLGTLVALVRVTSNDLRFWLVEVDYNKTAENFAKQDFERMRAALLSMDPSSTFRGKLETSEGRTEFWSEVMKKDNEG